LYAGNFEPKKNLPRLIQAVASLGKNAPELVFCGGIKPWRELEQSQLHARFLGFVSRGDLRVLMSACRVFCFPSLAEGFGLPVLEALACGAHVVASTEVPIAGLESVARTPNPRFWRSIAGAIEVALEDDSFEATRARDFARGFSWQQTARVWAHSYTLNSQ